MALRPVSELGLVDLTDLATPPEETTPVRRKARATGGRAQKAPARPKAPQPASQRSSDQPAKGARRGRVAARVGITAMTWAVAGATGVLLGRAAVRR